MKRLLEALRRRWRERQARQAERMSGAPPIVERIGALVPPPQRLRR